MLSDFGGQHLKQVLGSFNALTVDHRRQRLATHGFFRINVAVCSD